jgi:hypothetical protein
MLFLLACSSVDIDGVEPLGTVASAVAVDVAIDRFFIAGHGEVGEARAAALVLTSEPGWCAAEEARLASLASLAEAAVRSEDPTLCDIAGPLFAGTIAAEREAHDPERRTLHANVCAGDACEWDDVPVGEDLGVPSEADVFTSGGYTVLAGAMEGGEELWDTAGCAPASAYWEQASATTESWRVAEGALRFEAVGSTVAGDYTGLLIGSDDDVDGEFDARFSAQRCELRAEALVAF